MNYMERSKELHTMESCIPLKTCSQRERMQTLDLNQLHVKGIWRLLNSFTKRASFL